MKLLLCKKCQDVFKLQDFDRYCKCGKCGGRYKNDIDAEYWGKDAVPLGFANSTLATAIHSRPDAGEGSRFVAWVMAMKVSTYLFISEPKSKSKVTVRTGK